MVIFLIQILVQPENSVVSCYFIATFLKIYISLSIHFFSNVKISRVSTFHNKEKIRVILIYLKSRVDEEM